LEFDAAAFDDFVWWVEQDRSQPLRIVRLIRDIQRDPFSGLGKPEPEARTQKLLVPADRPGASGCIPGSAGKDSGSRLRLSLLTAAETTRYFDGSDHGGTTPFIRA
jgi:hypothetical protein